MLKLATTTHQMFVVAIHVTTIMERILVSYYFLNHVLVFWALIEEPNFCWFWRFFICL